MGNIFTFYTVSEVLKFEKVLKENNISVKLMPVPRSLSTSCGTCALTENNDLNEIKKLIEEKKLVYDEIHELQ